jgi:AraC-like DNA-binding protein
MQSSFLAALEDGPFLDEAEIGILNAAMMDMICHIATVKLGIADGNTICTSGKSQILTRAKAFIEANLSNSDLGPKSVARHCCVSTRYMNTVFSLSSESVASFIKEQRLQRCYEALQNRELLHRSIIDIAADWGFDNSSHFSQIYKARFGNPPSRDRVAGKLRLV